MDSFNSWHLMVPKNCQCGPRSNIRVWHWIARALQSPASWIYSFKIYIFLGYNLFLLGFPFSFLYFTRAPHLAILWATKATPRRAGWWVMMVVSVKGCNSGTSACNARHVFYCALWSCSAFKKQSQNKASKADLSCSSPLNYLHSPVLLSFQLLLTPG